MPTIDAIITDRRDFYYPERKAPDAFHVAYRPGAMTMELGRRWQRIAQEAAEETAEEQSQGFRQSVFDQMEAVRDYLLLLVIEWNLEERDPKTGALVPVPLTPEALERQPLPFLRQVVAWIQEDARDPLDDGAGDESSTSPRSTKRSTSGAKRSAPTPIHGRSSSTTSARAKTR